MYLLAAAVGGVTMGCACRMDVDGNLIELQVEFLAILDDSHNNRHLSMALLRDDFAQRLR